MNIEGTQKELFADRLAKVARAVRAGREKDLGDSDAIWKAIVNLKAQAAEAAFAGDVSIRVSSLEYSEEQLEEIWSELAAIGMVMMPDFSAKGENSRHFSWDDRL